MNTQSQRKGFTLAEVLISILLFSITVIVLFNLYKNYYAVFGMQQAHADVGISASTIISEVEKAALQADHIVASHIFSGTVYSSGSGIVVFELPSVNSSGDIIINSYDYIAFYATSTNAYEMTDAGSGSVRASGTRRLSNVLNTLVFTYNNSDFTKTNTVDVDVKTQTSAGGGQTIQTYLHQEVHFRNI